MAESAAPEHVLVVDDEPALRRLMTAMLESEGYATFEADNGEDALRVVETKPLDLAVLDVMLPGTTGIEVCKRIKALTPQLPVLMLTALHDQNTHRMCVDAGADDYLTKPVHRGELQLRVRSLLLLRRMQLELSQQNEVLTAQRDQLLKLQRQKHDFMEIMVHDLKNPLAAIVANASFVEQVKVVNDDLRDSGAAISRAAANMLRMVQNLLDVEREGERGLTAQLKPTDLVPVVERACALMARRAEERKIALSSAIEALGAVRADADYIRRVVENLLDNALRYTPRGGKVSVSLRRIEGEVELAVEDTGPGVPEEARARIFDKYAQLDRSVDREQQRVGRGLGLSFCRLVADAHGGRIFVEGGAAGGSRFVLRMPLEASAIRPSTFREE
jgi:two-component system sensor histidine kinase/response regulator